MRLPQTPPSVPRILLNIPAARLMEIVGKSAQWVQEDRRYLHWNELRRRPAPVGFTHEEWWAGIKLGRSLRSIGLSDKKGGNFGFGQPDSLNELVHQIDRGLGDVLGLPAAVGNAGTRDRYVVNTLIQESITSSQLEGAATTREVAKHMLRTGRPPRDKSERMIVNNYLTMKHIRDLRTTALTPELVFEVHRRVTDGTLERPDAAGRFRKAEENVRVENEMEGTVFHIPPQASELPDRLAAMCAFANGTEPAYFVHPVIRAIILHFWLAYDHPFVDGNGRTARALFYWCMLRNGYSLFEYISISEVLLRAPVQYGQAFLYSETDDNDLTYFLLHQAGVIRDAVESLHTYLKNKRAEIHSAATCLDGRHDLNHRQQALLAHALKEPGTEYLIQAHQRSHAVSYQTARDDLFGLAEKGLLKIGKQGRTYIFRVPHDLSSVLAQQARDGSTPPNSITT